MERIRQRFLNNRDAHRRGLLPYFTSGFPDASGTIELIRAADALGVTAVEIGFPYSDSIADGPIIQSSFHYVLERGHRLSSTFDLVAGVRDDVSCALVGMVSYSIVHRAGLHEFMSRCASAGFDGVILPDLPFEESAEASATVESAGMCHIGLVAPTTSSERRLEIARRSSGFIYQIAVAGLTGERAELPTTLPAEVDGLRRVSGLPVCVGFGISNADQVRAVCEFADGAIVGSAIVRRIAEGLREGRSNGAIIENTARFVGELMSGATSNQ